MRNAMGGRESSRTDRANRSMATRRRCKWEQEPTWLPLLLGKNYKKIQAFEQRSRVGTRMRWSRLLMPDFGSGAREKDARHRVRRLTNKERERRMSWAGADQINVEQYRTRRGYRRPAQVSARNPVRLAPTAALICFSHLRWHFVYQRPQHLMERFAREHRVFFVEEPVATDAAEPWLDFHAVEEGIQVVVPRMPGFLAGPQAVSTQRALLDQLLATEGVRGPLLYYFTPLALKFSDHIGASLVIYDCMDELSAFVGAPPETIELELALLARADLVFTGGVSLFEAKRHLHPNIHAFPSSVDVAHFARARALRSDPDDQARLPRPRLGFYGVIDERLDIELIDALAVMRPEWHLVMVGPVVKIDPALLPRRANIHWLGPKLYEELPLYLAGWDVALLPFARSRSTRFISPTKTPEYLAAGRPVVSTPITDVVRSYGEAGLARIAATAEDFVVQCEAALRDAKWPAGWLARVDRALGQMSWDSTYARMRELMRCAA
jgi:UDP-galactopyranose mutase